MRSVAPTGALQLKLDAWRSGGEFVRMEWDTFQDPSWLSMYAGSDDLPARHSPLADQIAGADLDEALRRMRGAIADTVARAETHDAFLKKLVGA